MKSKRLSWLLGLMGVLLVLRWWAPPRSGAEPASEVVAARVRPSAPASPDPVSNVEASAVSAGAPATALVASLDLPGNAFAVKVPKPPAPPPEPPRVKVVPFRGPPAPSAAELAPPPPPSPPPPPPLQVIGTWDDGQAPGVFIATGQGTVLARLGSVLLAEYRVTAITAQQVSVVHTGSKYEWHLTIPRVTANR